MGCDIHLFIEYGQPGTDRNSSFGREFRLDRNYFMFGLMAGVRGGDALIAPRGLPTCLAFSAKDAYFRYVSDSPASIGERVYVSKAIAAEWVESGSSVMEGEHYVSDPDAHTPSWLSTDEFQKVLDKVSPEDRSWVVEYFAVLAAMRELEKDGKIQARIVFWFDN